MATGIALEPPHRRANRGAINLSSCMHPPFNRYKIIMSELIGARTPLALLLQMEFPSNLPTDPQLL